MLLLYTVLLYLCFPFLLGYYLVRSLRRGKRLTGFRDRLGYSYRELRPAIGSRPVLWVHAVSVGEVLTAIPLVRSLRRRCPDHFFLVTAVTATGRRMVLENLPEADAFRYFPFDLPSSVSRAVDAVRPVLFVSLETEIWPNFLGALRRRGIPCGIVNGRISPRSFRRYGRVRWFMRTVLSGIDFIGMQTQEDAQRIRELGAPNGRVAIMGNMKYDGSLVLPFEKMEALRRRLGLEDDGKAPPIWVAGSTHPGEEEPILEAYREASVRCPRLRLAIVPRHPERFDSVAELIGERGFRYVRLSQAGCNDNEWEVVLGDTLGDLQALYGLAAIIFVGGSLVPVGGHNIMEAAAWGKPVLFGLHMHNFADAAARMRERGCGVQVSDARDLAGRVTEWLGSPDRLDALGKEALNVVQENRGAVDRALELMGPWLPEPGKGVARS